MKLKQEQIDEIMDNFPFSKVEKTMSALKWTWSDHGPLPPDEPAIRQFARELLNAVVAGSSLRCGGFCARKDVDGYLSLSFEVGMYEVWDD